jgi:hypothetical protein
MTAQLDIDRLLDDFLVDGAHQLSDHVLDAALGDIETTRQRRAWRVPRRSDMPTPLRLLAAAALLAAALGGAFLLGGNLNQTTPPEPAPSPPPTSANVEPVDLSHTLHGRWTSYSPPVFGSRDGDYVMVLSDDPRVVVDAPDDREILLGSLVDGQQEGRVIFGPTDRCEELGTYDFRPSDDYRSLSVELVEDTCTDRAKLLESSWVRNAIEGVLAPDQPYTIDLEPQVSFSIPPDFRDISGSPPNLLIPIERVEKRVIIDAEDYFVLVDASVHVQSDRCDRNAFERYMPTTLDEFVEWNRAATGVNVSEPVRTAVDGRDALYMDVGGTDDCPNGTVTVDCFCVPATGLTDVDGKLFERIWAIDVDGQIVLVEFHDDNPPWLALTPERLAVAQEFVESIHFE